MAGDTLHTDHCCVDHCPICNVINISTTFIANITLISSSILVLIGIVPLLQLMLEKTENEKKLTLVELKVILNN